MAVAGGESRAPTLVWAMLACLWPMVLKQSAPLLQQAARAVPQALRRPNPPMWSGRLPTSQVAARRDGPRRLPHASVMLVGRADGMLRVTHPQMVGCTGRRAEEEKKPRRLKVLDRLNATRGILQKLGSWARANASLPQGVPNTRIPRSETGMAWSPNQIWASGSS